MWSSSCTTVENRTVENSEFITIIIKVSSSVATDAAAASHLWAQSSQKVASTRAAGKEEEHLLKSVSRGKNQLIIVRNKRYCTTTYRTN